MTIEEKIADLGYVLPEERKVPANFENILIYNGYAYVSGTLPWLDGELTATGILGDSVSIDEGINCAEQCILNVLGNLKAKIGSLDNVEQIIKMTGYVASDKKFIDQATVMNGATDLLIDIFGKEKGNHSRAAVGAKVMPRNSPVEIELIIAIKQ